MEDTLPQTSRSAAPPASPAHIGTGTVALITAVRDELMPTVQRLKLQPDQPWYVGQIGSRRVVAAFTGVGRTRAMEVVRTLIEEHRPAHLISIGFAGGLDPTLAVGTVIDVQCVQDEHGSTYLLNQGIPQPLPTQAPRPTLPTLLTVDRLVHAVADKEQLFAKHRTVAVDMETYHLARLAHEANLRLTMLRAISDAAGMAIPQEAVGWVKPDGTDNVRAAILHLLTRPWKIPMTVRLGRNAHRAGSALADAVARKLQA